MGFMTGWSGGGFRIGIWDPVHMTELFRYEVMIWFDALSYISFPLPLFVLSPLFSFFSASIWVKGMEWELGSSVC